MNPSQDEGRQQVLAEALNPTLGGDHAVICRDAIQRHRQQYAVIVATSRTNLLGCVSLNTEEMTAAEGTAIAMALIQTGIHKVVTDFQQADRNYQSGSVSRPALRVQTNHSPNGSIQLFWTPAHASV